MQAILGQIKTQEILISNEKPDENTEENTTKPSYRPTTCFSVISSLTSEQSICDEEEEEFGIFARRAMVDQAREGLCYQ